MADKNEFKQRPVLKLAAQSAAWVAALFSLIVCILLIADFVRIRQLDPLNDPHLMQLHKELAVSPGDEALVGQIRTFDLYARRAFFSNQAQRRTGGFLLLGGTVVCFLALNLSRHWTPQLPDIGKPEPVNAGELNALFRQLMAGAGIFLAAVALFLAFAVQSDLAMMLTAPGTPVPHEAQHAQPSILTAMASNWPSLRGPDGLGVAYFTNAPVSWNIESGDGVRWEMKIPLHGFNSPIVWGQRIFLTGADDQSQEVYCFDADTGELLWTRQVKSEKELPDVSDDTGYAAPTMATDGQRVFAIFSTGELAAFDFNGSPVWQKNLGVPNNPYGKGSSLITDGQRLFVQYDHQDVQKVMAFDCATGDLVWQTARKLISWSSPVLIETASGRQLILNDEQYVTAYDPVSGRQIWTVRCLGGEVAPSPAFNGKDIVFVANEYAQASALKLTGGTPEILWQYDNYLPEISSPVASENFFFITTSAGDAVCLDAATGEVKWEQEFDHGFNSSPVLVGDRIYAIDLTGVVHIFSATGEYIEIGTVPMGEPVYATPAFMDKRIYIRGDEHLYCIRK